MRMRQFIFFHEKQHPREMAGPKVQKFLNHLAVNRHLAVSTQAQALECAGLSRQDLLQQPLGRLTMVMRPCL
jgi:hypothetical protein